MDSQEARRPRDHRGPARRGRLHDVRRQGDARPSRPTSRAPSRSTRAATCGCWACRSASVDTVTPSGTDVVVTMTYDASVKVPADAAAVIVSPSIVGDRFVQLTPVYTGGDVLADEADPRHRPHGRASRARPDLPEHGRPDGGARTQRRQRQGRADRPARDDRRQLRRPGREVPPDHRGLQRADRHPRRQQGGAVRLRRRARGAYRDPGRGTTRPCAGSTSRWRRSPRCSPASGRAGRLAAQPGRGHEAGVRFREGEPRDPRQQHQGPQPGRQGAGQAARRPRRDPHRRADRPQQPGPDLQPAGRHPRHPRQPAGARPPDRERPGHPALRVRQPGRPGRPGLRRHQGHPRRAPAAPRAGAFGQGGVPAPEQFDPTLGGLVEVQR